MTPRASRCAAFPPLAIALASWPWLVAMGALSGCGDSRPRRHRPDAGPSLAARIALPLSRDSTVRHSRRALGRGVTYEHVVRGRSSTGDFFTIEVAAPAARGEADRIAAAVHIGAERARVDRTRDGRRWRVRIGRFRDQRAAARALAALGEIPPAPPPRPGVDPDEARAHAHVVFTGEDGVATTGPWSIHVLEIDPAAGARVELALAGDRMLGRATVRAIAGARRPLAAVNAGYFVMETADGTPGDPAGVCVLGGALVSEAIEGRAALVLEPRPGGAWAARVAKIHTRIRVTGPSGTSRDADGIDRTPGLIRNCGGSGGDVPSEIPMHDFTCTDANELVVLDSRFGPRSPPGDGIEIVLGPDDRVTEVRERRGGPIGERERILVATGDVAGWLRSDARPGATFRIEMRVTDEAGRELPRGATVVNGGPRLVQRGRIDVTARDEGFDYLERPEMLEHFALRRHPRTIVGVTGDGTLLLVVVDGRQPGRSVGLTFYEEAHLMRSLGAVDALNLDGGGSSTMVIGGRVVNSPSDASGERAVGDALIVR